MKPATHIGAKPRTHRNATTSPLRFALEAELAKLPRGKTLSAEELAQRCDATENAVTKRLRQMAHDGMAVNTVPPNTKAQWRLTKDGRRLLLPDEPPAPNAEAATPGQQLPPDAAGLRTWHNNSQPTAERGSLSPWAGGNPLRDGSQTAFTLTSGGR
jgi:hypothetical protein